MSAHRRRRRLTAFTVLWTCVLAMASSTAQAKVDCPAPTPTHPFAPWMDLAPYVLAKGGSFEQGIAPWRGHGSPVRWPENDFWQLAADNGTWSIRLRGDQAITSPVLCVSVERPYLRFVARAVDPASSSLVVEVLWKDRGRSIETVVGEPHQAQDWQQWAPSQFVPFGNALPMVRDKHRQVRLRFSLEDAAGDWLLDDVFVDPVKRG